MESFLNESQKEQECLATIIYFQLWKVFCALCFFVGCPASLMVLWELHKRSHQRTSSEVFMLSLTTADLGVSVSIPINILPVVWTYESLVWFYKLINGITLCARPLFMACICMDCYFAVVYPIKYRTYKNINIMRKVSCVIVWLITLLFIEPHCSQLCQIPTYISSFPMIVSLPVMTFCNISILRALRKPDPSGRNNIHPQKKRALRTIFNSMIMTLITYLPPVLIFLTVSLPQLDKIANKCKVSILGYVLSTSGNFIMPLLYLDTMGKFDHLKDLLKNIFVTDS